MPDQVDWRAIEREAGPGQAVGRLLRDQREARGLDLTQVEKSIRIRRAHLEAIEEGRYDKLPGAAYIPAFLRAYATHVGLDPEKVMTAYHLSGAVPIKRPVALPANFPVADRRAPIGLAVLTVLLVVGAGYGVWHYMPQDQAVVAAEGAARAGPSALRASQRAGSRAAQSVRCPACRPSPAPETRTISGSLPAQVWPRRNASKAVAGSGRAAGAAGGRRRSRTAAAGRDERPVDRPGAGRPAAGADRAAAHRAPKPVEEANARGSPKRAPPPIAGRGQYADQREDRTAGSNCGAPNGDVLTQTHVRAGESYVVPAGIAYRITEAR